MILLHFLSYNSGKVDVPVLCYYPIIVTAPIVLPLLVGTVNWRWALFSHFCKTCMI